MGVSLEEDNGRDVRLDAMLGEGGGGDSLCYENDRHNIDSFRGFIEKFTFIYNRSETLVTLIPAKIITLIKSLERIAARVALLNQIYIYQ